MALRKIDENIPIPNFEKVQAAAPKWESLQCRLVTPMYGGGVKSAEPDIQQPIRVTAIRGQLRFWWRLLASQKVFELPENVSIRQAEFALWGGMNDGDESGKASAVLLRVNKVLFEGKNTKDKNKKSEIAPYTDYAPRMSDILNYVLFPARDTDIHLLKPEFSWQLEWHIDKNAPVFWRTEKKDSKEKRIEFLDETYQELNKQVIETLRWWTTFGGLGARTRRGCGAFIVEQSTRPEIVRPIVEVDIKKAGCQFAITTDNAPNAIKAWEIAVKRLRDFRQGAMVGRNKDKGYSLWKEANAIKSIVKDPRTSNKSPFARGMFGMPIIFNFIGQDDIDVLGTHRFSLQPENKERMASPLIIKPIYQNKQWHAVALLLPYKLILKGQLKIEPKKKGKKTNIKQQKIKEIKSVYIWDDAQTSSYSILPIENNGGEDPLKAFMTYFAKSNKK